MNDVRQPITFLSPFPDDGKTAFLLGCTSQYEVRETHDLHLSGLLSGSIGVTVKYSWE